MPFADAKYPPPRDTEKELLKALRFVLPTLCRAMHAKPLYDDDGFCLIAEAAREAERAIRIAEGRPAND